MFNLISYNSHTLLNPCLHPFLTNAKVVLNTYGFELVNATYSQHVKCRIVPHQNSTFYIFAAVPVNCFIKLKTLKSTTGYSH